MEHFCVQQIVYAVKFKTEDIYTILIIDYKTHDVLIDLRHLDCGKMLNLMTLTLLLLHVQEVLTQSYSKLLHKMGQKFLDKQ